MRMTSCQRALQGGERCKRTIAADQKFCWQHTQGWRAKYRSLTRSQHVAFWLGFTSLVLTIVGVITAVVPTRFMQLEGMAVQSPGFISGKPVHIVPTMMNRGAAP